MAQSRATIFQRKHSAKQSSAAHLNHDLAIKLLLHLGRARSEISLRKCLSGFTHQPLVFGELIVEIDGAARFNRSVVSGGSKRYWWPAAGAAGCPAGVPK
jgi:hypothetical protein